MHDDENYRYIANNKFIDLTVTENKILKVLIDNKGKIVSYQKLTESVYDNYYYDKSYKEAMIAHLHRLRKKLNGYIEIKNKPGIGIYI